MVVLLKVNDDFAAYQLVSDSPKPGLRKAPESLRKYLHAMAQLESCHRQVGGKRKLKRRIAYPFAHAFRRQGLSSFDSDGFASHAEDWVARKSPFYRTAEP